VTIADITRIIFHHHRLSRIRPLGLFRFKIYFLKLTNLLDRWQDSDWERHDARPPATHRTTQRKKTRTYIHASSGIRNCGPSFRAAEVSMCFRLLDHWDRQE